MIKSILAFIAASFAPCNTGWPTLPAGQVPDSWNDLSKKA